MASVGIKICSVEGCSGEHLAKGLCSKHYYVGNKEKILTQQNLYRKKNKKKKANSQLKPHNIFVTAIRGAKRRGISFTLSQQDFQSIRPNNCYYCNKPFVENYGVGLDRINNEIGYEIYNVLPCCGVCNTTRNRNWTVEETKVMIDAVMNYRTKLKVAT